MVWVYRWVKVHEHLRWYCVGIWAFRVGLLVRGTNVWGRGKCSTFTRYQVSPTSAATASWQGNVNTARWRRCDSDQSWSTVTQIRTRKPSYQLRHQAEYEFSKSGGKHCSKCDSTRPFCAHWCCWEPKDTAPNLANTRRVKTDVLYETTVLCTV